MFIKVHDTLWNVATVARVRLINPADHEGWFPEVVAAVMVAGHPKEVGITQAELGELMKELERRNLMAPVGG